MMPRRLCKRTIRSRGIKAHLLSVEMVQNENQGTCKVCTRFAQELLLRLKFIADATDALDMIRHIGRDPELSA